MSFGISNESGSLWILHQSLVQCSMVCQSEHHFLLIQHTFYPSPVLFSWVHAKCTAKERLPLWASLNKENVSSTLPWVIGEDFDVILDVEEKRGG